MIYRPNIILCCSSSALILNSLYGYKIKKINLCVIDSLSAVASLIYWLDTKNMNKRNIDILLANINFLNFFIYGINNQKKEIMPFLWFNLFNIFYNFSLSCLFYKYKYKKWYYFHLLFHASGIFQKLLVYHF